MIDVKEGQVTPELFKYIEKRIEQEILILEESDAYGGNIHNPIPSRLRKEVEMYRLGYIKELPQNWIDYKKEFENLKNPEYAEYLRLKSKFG